jgi:uncharacterized protein DUF4169
MAEIVNLKDFRKARARAEADIKASENRARFGRSRDERGRQSVETQRARREHDGNKLERASDRARHQDGNSTDSDTPSGD